MTSRMSKLAVAGVILAAVVSFGLFDSFTKPAWAIEQAIEAVKEYRALHMTGTIPGRTFESWMRSNRTMTQTQDVVARDSNGGVAWVKNGSTYLYDPGPNTVYVENAITQGFSQWPGPELLEMFAKAKGAELLHGKDPATGRDRVTLLCSLVDAEGPQSWTIEFDVASKLPVSFTCWPNLDRSGTPAFDATKITYYKDLSDSLFDVHVPGHPAYVEKPLTIPEENIDLLSNPDDGMTAEGSDPARGRGEDHASQLPGPDRRRLAATPAAVPAVQELGRRDAPRHHPQDGQARPDRGARHRSSRSARQANPSWVRSSQFRPCSRHADGTKIEEKLIVQFRQLGDKSSCVIYGPYGFSRDIE